MIMAKEVIIFGVPLLITLAYIIYRIVVNIKEDGVFDFLFIHITTRKYKMTSKGPRKIVRKKIKRIPIIVLFIVNGLFILISSFILYNQEVMHQAVPVLKALKVSAKPSFDDIYDKVAKLLGPVSTLVGIFLGIKELSERKSNKNKE
jgi:hypothetical protein